MASPITITTEAQAIRYLQSLDSDARARLDQDIFSYEAFKRTYRRNAVGFVEDCIDWNRTKERPATYQLDAVQDLFAKPFANKEAVRGPRGLGKTAFASWIVHFFALTRDDEGSHDWKIITTAGTGKQLTMFLWPEIKKWARLLRWDVIGRNPYREGAELLEVMLKLATGQASAMSAIDPELIEGAHAHSILYIFDEAKSIVAKTFDASEGAFSGAGPETGREAYALAISTPGEPTGRFYAIHTKQAGLEDWRTKHVTRAQAVASGRISASWAEQRRKQWGESSQLYQNHVLGEFASGQTDGVIPLSWLEQAYDRYRIAKRDGLLPKPNKWSAEHKAMWMKHMDEPVPEVLLNTIGADCSYGGADKSTLAELCGVALVAVDQVHVQSDEMPTIKIANAVHRIQQLRGGVAIVDVVGVGGGTVDQLRQLRAHVMPFSAGSKAMKKSRPAKDVSGTLGFGCLRDAAWWNMRELLDPVNGYDILLPPDEDIPAVVASESSLMAELLAPKFEVDTMRSVIRVESKDELRKPDRLGRSTDWADAVVQAFALDYMSGYRQPGDLGMS